jgi:hypothetical protein
MGNAFYIIDIIISLTILGFFSYMHYRKRFNKAVWYMFWAGVFIGATWEIGFYFVGPEFSSAPAYVFHTEFPLPSIILHILHCFWDGALFMVGVGLIHIILKPPHMTNFRLVELGIMVIWGMIQETAVEFISLGGGMWEYVGRWYNPSLFKVGDSDFTLLPLLIWVVAPVVFYLIALKIKKKWDSITIQQVL